MAQESAQTSTERRRISRQRPDYSPEEISALRILQVYFRPNSIFCLLSDGKTLSVPLEVSPALAAAEPVSKYQWQLDAGGKIVAWHTGGLTEELALPQLLGHPRAAISCHDL